MQHSTFNYPELTECLRENRPVVLATVIRTHGSTPQKAGSSALIEAGRILAGTVGGGMTESKVLQESQTALKKKKSGLFSFDLHGEIAKGSDSICGGGMTILLDAFPNLHLDVFRQLNDSLEQHIPGVLITRADKSNREKIEISRHWVTKTKQPDVPVDWDTEIGKVLSEMLENRGTFCQAIEATNPEAASDDLFFLEYIGPKPSLIIVGAGHIGCSLAHLGQFLGFEVTVWDDRPEYADRTQIPDADFVWSGPLDSVLEQLKIGADSYLVIVTRSHKDDAEALRKFISRPSAYLGMIGSKAKISQMKTAFLENGWASREQWERIFTPVGIDIGALTVDEIAVSIAAQLIQVRNKRCKTA